MRTNLITPRTLKALYDQGKNISAYLREMMGVQYNTEEIIEISYDLQAGSYIAKMQSGAMSRIQETYSQELANQILALGGGIHSGGWCWRSYHILWRFETSKTRS